MSELPVEWTWSALGEVADINPRNRSDLADDESVSFVPMAAVEAVSGRMDASDCRTVGDLRKRSYRYFIEGDVLFAKITPCMENGKVALAEGLTNGAGFGSTEFHVLRTSIELDPRYLLHYLLQPVFRKEAARDMKGTAGQLRVPYEYLANCLIPLPPRREQSRIVDAIEEQLSRIDAGIAGLTLTQKKLKRMQAAVLQRTCSGDGTWKEVEIQETTKIVDYRGRTPPFDESGIPHLRSFNIKNGSVRWAGCAYVSQQTYDRYMSRGFPAPGDLLFTTEAPMGEVAEVPKKAVFCLAQRMMLVKPDHTRWLSEYLMYHLRSPWFQGKLRRNATGTTVQGISSRNFRPLRVLCPPLAEQEDLMRVIRAEIDSIERLMLEVNEQLLRANRLRSAVLKDAFAGRLVDQDPSDEPASELLARVAASAETVRAPRRQRAKALGGGIE